MYKNSVQILQEKLNEAEAVVIGAGAGLSTAAGFAYFGERFHRLFHDFEVKYNFHDMYSGGFYPYATPEEFWAYWSRYIWCNRYQNAPLPVYEKLFDAVRDKNYFVLTTNVDHCFQKAGFDKRRLFYTQGDYGLFQCSEPCCNVTYDNEQSVLQMVAEQSDMKIPSQLVPRCPVCGKPLTVNLRSDGRFVEDEGWHAACKRYEKFLSDCKNKRTLFLELGVGFNTPGIIKYPFWQMTLERKNAFFVCINRDCCVPQYLAKKSLCIEEDIATVLNNIV